MIRLAALDLDCTLAAHGKGIKPADIALLKQLEQRGVKIAICSGKPVYYLCGMFRQVGLQQPIFVGEVGATIHFGVDLPPKYSYTLPYPAPINETFRTLRREILRAVPDMWFQPNEVNLSLFPKSEEEFAIVRDIIARHRAQLEKTNIYFYSDAVDFVPKPINKRKALEYLSDLLHIAPQEMAAVGDSPSDYPMFAYAGTSIGIRLEEPAKAQRQAQSCTEALELILSSVQ